MPDRHLETAVAETGVAETGVEGAPLSCRSPRRAAPAAACVVALFMLLLAACSSGGGAGGGATGDAAQADQDSSDQPDASETDGGESSEGGSDDAESQDGGSPIQAGPGSGVMPTDPGQCGVTDVNREPFLAVANIPPDDPDGGLNIRDDFQGGSVLDTLAASTVVYVADCAIADDGGVWFAVETKGGTAGWANSAFLSTEISPLEPTSGGEETERKVTAVIDAMAARKWPEAAAELLSAPRAFDTLAPLLERGGADDDLPALLERYCQARLCDAPYEVIDVRGSYFPDRISPEVDVRFDYPDGQAVETFTRTWPQNGEFSLRTLPGQSNLAWSTTRPTADALGATGSPDADDGLIEAAESVRQALLSNDSASLVAPFLAPQGIAVSPSAYVAPETAARVTVTSVDLASTRDESRIWGYTDGVGTAIVQDVDQWLAGYRSAPALLEPDETSVDERLGSGNTIANIAEVFPAARVVEFHRQGRGELSDFNWSSVRLGFEERPDGWVLVAITSDTWTI